MTSSMAPRPVDLDLLADYVEGVLDGPASAEVAALIAADEGWASAHGALRTSLPQVTEDLRAYADVPAAMPADVAARISTALAAEADSWVPFEAERPLPFGAEHALAAEAGSPLAGASADVGQPLAVSPGLVSEPTEVTRAAARDRLAKRAERSRVLTRGRLVLAAGAVAVVALGVGIGIAATHEESTTAGSSGAVSSAEAPQAAGGAKAASGDLPSLPGVTITASGRAYTQSTLRSSTMAVPAPASPASAKAPSGSAFGGSVLPQLTRLLSAGPLGACTAAIAQTAGSAPQAVDFATFDGAPALIVTLADGGVFVAGPNCGLPGQAADEITRG